MCPTFPGFEYNVNRVMLLASTMWSRMPLIRFYVLHDVAFPLRRLPGHSSACTSGGSVRMVGCSRPPDRFRPDPYRVVQRSDTKESFRARRQEHLWPDGACKGTCPTVDKGPYNYVFTWPHLLRAELLVFLLTTALVLALSFIDAPLEEPANLPSRPTLQRPLGTFWGCRRWWLTTLFGAGWRFPG